MKRPWILASLLLVSAAGTPAKDKPTYERGTVLQMDSASCGYAEKDNKSLAGQILGTEDQHKKAEQVLCQEYTLQTERVTYRIRPKDDRHAALLPIGETAEFRIHKDKLLLRVVESNGREREYTVISMTPRVITAQNPSTAAAR